MKGFLWGGATIERVFGQPRPRPSVVWLHYHKKARFLSTCSTCACGPLDVTLAMPSGCKRAQVCNLLDSLFFLAAYERRARFIEALEHVLFVVLLWCK